MRVILPVSILLALTACSPFALRSSFGPGTQPATAESPDEPEYSGGDSESSDDHESTAGVGEPPPTSSDESSNSSNQPTPPTPPATPARPEPIFTADFQGRGALYYALGGTKGVVLCFHGRTGSARGWSPWANQRERNQFILALRAAGYSFVCPSSLDDVAGEWASGASTNNSDIRNVDAILNELQVPSTARIFLVGHSLGTAMATRYSRFSQRASRIVASHLANGAGLLHTPSATEYRLPTLLAYAECDAVVSFQKIQAAEENLQKLGLRHRLVKLDEHYESGAFGSGEQTCHEFVDTSAETLRFFAQ